MYEVAIIFNEKISEVLLTSIGKLLNELGFTSTVILQNTSKVMMLYLRNVINTKLLIRMIYFFRPYQICMLNYQNIQRNLIKHRCWLKIRGDLKSIAHTFESENS